MRRGLIGPPGPEGPAGIAGPTGQRGSIWLTGTTDPDQPGEVEGDMWLDTTTGNVWRWDQSVGPSGMWVRDTGEPV